MENEHVYRTENLDGDVVTIIDTDIEFIDFTKVLVNENGDDTEIDSTTSAVNYIKEFCPDLKLTITIKDLTFGTDNSGENCVFIDTNHINGWKVDNDVKSFVIQMIYENEIHPYENEIYFRVIDNGVETDSHGWLSIGLTKRKIGVVQWG
jgi:hypothetical protein